jgi:magnesium-transporting ATPase (P-type)
MDTRLYQCFAILLSFASSLFGYQFNINNKYQLCKLIKNYVTLNSKVLAIGDGLNDFMMLKEADLSIGIYSREIFQVRNTCDIIVTKFSQIVDLILVHGSWNLHRLIKISFFSIYANVLIIFPIFVYQSEITIDSAFFYLNRWQLVLKLLIINLSILLIICFDHYVERPLIGINTMLYNENFIEKGEYYKMFIKACMKGIIDAIIIIYNVMLNCRTNINIIGETIDINIFAETIFITSFIIIFLEVSITLHIALRLFFIFHKHSDGVNQYPSNRSSFCCLLYRRRDVYLYVSWFILFERCPCFFLRFLFLLYIQFFL